MKINIQEYKYLKDMNIFREYILNGLIPLFIFKQNSSKTQVKQTGYAQIHIVFP